MPRTDRFRWARRGAAVGLALATALALSPTAGAAQETIQPTPTGYYTQTQDPTKTAGGEVAEVVCDENIPSPDPRTCIDPSQATGGTPAYPRKDNYVYVANVNGNTDSIGVAGVPLFSIGFGSTITALRIEFDIEDNADSGTLNFTRENPGVLICLATGSFVGQDGAPWESRPESDCSVNATPEPAGEPDGDIHTFAADLMPMAQAWADGREEHGIVFRPSRDAPDNFQVAIRSPAVEQGMRIFVEYTAAAPPPSFDFGEVSGGFGAPTSTTVTFGGSPPVPEQPAQPFTVEETPAPEQPLQAAPRVARNPNPQNKWWMFIGLPLGLAVAATLAHGVAEPLTTTGLQRVGPVGRLMNRNPIDEGVRP